MNRHLFIKYFVSFDDNLLKRIIKNRRIILPEENLATMDVRAELEMK